MYNTTKVWCVCFYIKTFFPPKIHAGMAINVQMMGYFHEKTKHQRLIFPSYFLHFPPS